MFVLMGRHLKIGENLKKHVGTKIGGEPSKNMLVLMGRHLKIGGEPSKNMLVLIGRHLKIGGEPSKNGWVSPWFPFTRGCLSRVGKFHWTSHNLEARGPDGNLAVAAELMEMWGPEEPRVSLFLFSFFFKKTL